MTIGSRAGRGERLVPRASTTAASRNGVASASIERTSSSGSGWISPFQAVKTS